MKIKHTEDHGKLRQREYPGESEQVHALMKLGAAMAELLRANGIEVPADFDKIQAQVESVKQRYRKPK